MTDWNIQPRARACTACQQPFVDKGRYHTLLLLNVQGYQRQDLCSACFGAAQRDAVYSYWQGEYKTPLPPPPEPIQKDTAETMLRQLIESTDPTHSAARYILAVMLERKRLLKHRDTIRDATGGELLVYEHVRSGESFTLPDPHLRLDQLEQVQREVMNLLQPPPPPAPESAKAEPVTDSASASQPT